jgi:hypothetical protein
VRAAIRDAQARRVQEQKTFDQALEEAPDFQDFSLALGWAAHVSDDAHQAAGIARIQAILLTVLHLEGAVNAWGVIVTGEDFYKQHLERQRIESKVALLLAIDGQGRIPPDHDVPALLRTLFMRRNQIAHRKTKETRRPFDFDSFGRPAFEEDLSLCREALDAFRDLLLRACPRAAWSAGYRKRVQP